MTNSTTPPPTSDTPSNRRTMLRRGAVAVGAGLVGAATLDRTAAAAPAPVYLGEQNTSAAVTTISSSGVNGAAFVGTMDQPTGFNWGLSGFVKSADGIGVRGNCDSPTGTTAGVSGVAASPDGAGVTGEAPAGIGGTFDGGRAALQLKPTGAAPATRSDAHSAGEIVFDTTNHLWVCTAAGTPGTWQRLTNPSTHPVSPFRVYDSRFGDGKLSSGTSRVVSVRESIESITGAVIATDLVPAGAAAVFFNLTITETVSHGFLATGPGDAATVESSSINWAGTGLTIANGTLVSLDANRQIKVFANGFADAAAHFVIDITAFIA